MLVPHILHFDVFYLRISAVLKWKTLLPLLVPKHYFSEVFCTIIIYLQQFQILKWRKFMAAIFKSSSQNLSPLPPRLKVKSTDSAISWT